MTLIPQMRRLNTRKEPTSRHQGQEVLVLGREPRQSLRTSTCPVHPTIPELPRFREENAVGESTEPGRSKQQSGLGHFSSTCPSLTLTASTDQRTGGSNSLRPGNMPRRPHCWAQESGDPALPRSINLCVPWKMEIRILIRLKVKLGQFHLSHSSVLLTSKIQLPSCLLSARSCTEYKLCF